MIFWNKVIATYHNIFNVWYALISFFPNFIIAMWVNGQYGPKQYLWAGLAQGIASFLSTGLTAGMIQHFSPIRSAPKSYLFGTIVPVVMMFVISLTAHLWNGTPRVLASCIAPTLITFSTSFPINWLTRRHWLLPVNYPKKNEK